MKLLLINPNDNNTSRNPALNEYVVQNPHIFIMRQPSLPLLTVAALTPEDIEVEYVDENVSNIDLSCEADLVGITGMTQQAVRAYEIADGFRSRRIKVVMGGIHATVLPEEAKQHADSVVIGEAEDVWTTCISDFLNGSMKEYYHGGMPELKKSPLPRYDLARDFDFAGSPLSYVPIQVSRGCPNNCAFCTVTSIYGKKYRTKTVQQVVREFESILAACRFQNMVIKFNDDNPFIDKKFTKAMLRAITPLKAKWFSLADISIARSPDILDLLRESGCLALGIGFESVDPHVLDDVSHWKRKYLQSYAESVRIIKEHGMIVAGSFMFGFDHDTVETFRRVRDFVLENNVPSKYSIVTPFPGTRLYDKICAQGRLKKELNWSHYNFLNVVYKTKMPEALLMEELRKLYEETWSQQAMNQISASNATVMEKSERLRKQTR